MRETVPVGFSNCYMAGQSGPSVACTIGPDGAGKSTQARKPVRTLRDSEIDCDYRWLEPSHPVSLPLLVDAQSAGRSELTQLERGQQVGYHYFER